MRDVYRSARQSDPDLNRQFQRVWSKPSARTAEQLEKLAGDHLLAGDGTLADDLTWAALLRPEGGRR